MRKVGPVETRVVSVGIGLPANLLQWLANETQKRSSPYSGMSRAAIIRTLIEKEIKRNGARRKSSRA